MTRPLFPTPKAIIHVNLSFLGEASWYFFFNFTLLCTFYFIRTQGVSELIAHLSDGCEHLLGGMRSMDFGVRPLAGSPTC